MENSRPLLIQVLAIEINENCYKNMTILIFTSIILLVSTNDVLKPWEEFEDLQQFDNQSENR